jgi:hypothetical protein
MERLLGEGAGPAGWATSSIGGSAIGWTEQELEQVGQAFELELASRRADGGLRRYITMWTVRIDKDLYVRSAGGPDRPWYRRARASGSGRIRAATVQRDVTFATAEPADQAAIDAAYQAKYGTFGPESLRLVTGPDAHPVTIRLVPAGKGHG